MPAGSIFPALTFYGLLPTGQRLDGDGKDQSRVPSYLFFVSSTFTLMIRRPSMFTIVSL